jgi:hypothetical protein
MDRVLFKTAKLLLKKGFNWYDRHGMETSLYSKKGDHVYYANYGMMGSGISEGYISAPLQTTVQKWVRHEHKLLVYVTPSFKIFHCTKTEIKWRNNNSEVSARKLYDTYEEAVEAGILDALKYIK